MKSLTLEQRAFVVGEQGICPACEKEVEWADIDTDWYVCKECINMIQRPQDINEQDAHMMGYMDGMGDLLRSVLADMIDKGEIAINVARNVITEVESEKDVKLK